MSDAYCRLSTGAGFTVRGLYKDDEEMVFGGANPVLFNGIPELGDKSDFLSRSIRVRLPTIPPQRRKTERYLEHRWNELGPPILGSLYDLIANGLKNEAFVVDDGNAPRMIDNYHWFRACEIGTGLRLADRFRENYDTLIREVAFETLTGKAVLAFMRDRRLTKLGEMPEELEVWRGTMSALHEGIKPKWLEVCDGSTKQRNLLPGSPARLTNAIDAIASSLVANGIVFTRGRSNDQRWAQIDARRYFQGEAGETIYLSECGRDVAQDGLPDQVTTPLPAGVTT
jgi:putative DNA primase/helicase